MGKEMNVSSNEQQGTFKLSESSSIDADAGKISWHSPKFRTLKVSQGTSTPATSGAVG